jgi:hypothetical protein
MLTATTSIRSNRSIFVSRDTGSPNDDLLKHISNLDSMARLDFERCSVAGEVIYAIEGDAMPTSQQDEEARVGTLAYALKKLNPTDVRPTAVASDSASTVRAFGEIHHESRAYREYLKGLNEIDRQLLNDAVDRRQQHRNDTTAGERRDPLPILEKIEDFEISFFSQEFFLVESILTVFGLARRKQRVRELISLYSKWTCKYGNCTIILHRPDCLSGWIVADRKTDKLL